MRRQLREVVVAEAPQLLLRLAAAACEHLDGLDMGQAQEQCVCFGHHIVYALHNESARVRANAPRQVRDSGTHGHLAVRAWRM